MLTMVCIHAPNKEYNNQEYLQSIPAGKYYLNPHEELVRVYIKEDSWDQAVIAYDDWEELVSSQDTLSEEIRSKGFEVDQFWICGTPVLHLERTGGYDT